MLSIGCLHIYNIVDHLLGLGIEAVDEVVVIGFGREPRLGMRHAADVVAVHGKDIGEHLGSTILLVVVKRLSHALGKQQAANVVDVLFQCSFELIGHFLSLLYL